MQKLYSFVNIFLYRHVVFLYMENDYHLRGIRQVCYAHGRNRSVTICAQKGKKWLHIV